MKQKMVNWLGMSLVLEIGLLHWVAAQHEFEEAAILGYLFVLNFLGMLGAAYGMYRGKRWGWGLGAVIAVGSGIGYIWSRTLGLPGAAVEAWLFPAGIIAFVTEWIFIFLLLLRPWKQDAFEPTSAILVVYGKLVPVVLTVCMVLLTGFVSLSLKGVDHAGHAEMASQAEVSRLQPLSAVDFEQEYGIRVSQAAISMLGAAVDVRIKVTDPDKAEALLDSHSALLVDEKSLVLAPHMHNPTKVKPGQIYVMFFPTQNGTVRTGSLVSLVFGDVRVEPVVTK